MAGILLRIIANAFDLPPQALGLEKDVNRSTAAEMTDQAFRQAIVPTARLFAEHLTRDAISKKLGWHDLEFVFSDVDSSGSEIEQAQIQEILIRNGVLTVNEVRRMRGCLLFRLASRTQLLVFQQSGNGETLRLVRDGRAKAQARSGMTKPNEH